MSINATLFDKRGKPRIISICLTDLVGDKKKELNEEKSIWKCDGGILKDDHMFKDYINDEDIEENNVIFLTNGTHRGGINKKNS